MMSFYAVICDRAFGIKCNQKWVCRSLEKYLPQQPLHCGSWLRGKSPSHISPYHTQNHYWGSPACSLSSSNMFDPVSSLINHSLWKYGKCCDCAWLSGLGHFACDQKVVGSNPHGWQNAFTVGPLSPTAPDSSWSCFLSAIKMTCEVTGPVTGKSLVRIPRVCRVILLLGPWA